MRCSPQLSHRDFVAVLSRCSTRAHLEQLHAHAFVAGRAAAQTTTFHLLRFAALRLSCLAYARRLFDATPHPNVFLYSAILSAYVSAAASSSHSSHAHDRDALTLFLRMLRHGRPVPNQFVYPLVLRAACAVGVHIVKSIHSHACKSGFCEYEVVRTSLLDGYSRYGMMADARNLFDGLTERNVVSWTALVSGYSRSGKVGDAIVLFERMPERDVPAWNAIITGCSQNGLFVEAVGIFGRMVGAGFQPNATTVSCVLSACGHLGMLKIGKLIHSYAWRTCVGFGSSVLNGLIDMYGKCGNLEGARWIFDKVSDRSLTTWNSLINCLALHGHSKHAISVFNEMKDEGVEPDVVTFVGLLNACTHGGFVDEGLKYFELMLHEHGIEPEIEHYGCIVDLLGRAGRFHDALNVISDMRIESDEVIWGSLLNACKIHRQVELAELAIQKLLELDPNNANYVVMLANVYSEGGLWEEVSKVRKFVNEDSNIGKKLPGCSWIEVDRKTHRFYSGDDAHPEAENIYDTLEDLAASMEL